MYSKVKVFIYVAVLLFTRDMIGSNNDSIVKKYRWFINTYPSALVTGDFSIGTEFNYKRIRQEAAFFYKTFSLLDNYKFDKGIRFNYYIKYNLINKKKFLLSFDMGYSYRERRFNNKNDNWTELEGFNGDKIRKSIYLMDRKESLNGLSFGFSSLFKIYKRFFIGLNLNCDIINYRKEYTSKKYVSGEKIYISSSPFSPIYIEPEFPYTEKLVLKRYFLPNLLFKITYEIF